MIVIQNAICSGMCESCEDHIDYKAAGIVTFGEEYLMEDHVEDNDSEHFLCLDCHTTLIEKLTASRDKLINDPPVRKMTPRLPEDEDEEDEDVSDD